MVESVEGASCSPGLLLKCFGMLGKSLDPFFLSFHVFKDVQTYHRTWVLQELINCHLYSFEDL